MSLKSCPITISNLEVLKYRISHFLSQDSGFSVFPTREITIYLLNTWIVFPQIPSRGIFNRQTRVSPRDQDKEPKTKSNIRVSHIMIHITQRHALRANISSRRRPVWVLLNFRPKSVKVSTHEMVISRIIRRMGDPNTSGSHVRL